jgi:hypothetical protein
MENYGAICKITAQVGEEFWQKFLAQGFFPKTEKKIWCQKQI